MTDSVVAEFANACGWHFWSLAQAPPGDDYLVVLLPRWSPQDIVVVRAVKPRIPTELPVFVVDIDSLVRDSARYRSVLPEAPIVTQTPAALHYRNGQLVSIWQGGDELADIRVPSSVSGE